VSIHLNRKARTQEVNIGERTLPGTLSVPENATGIVVFAHGSGSSRLSPRNIMVSEALNRAGLATLLFDLLDPEEEYAQNRAKVFDIPLLGSRLVEAVHWLDRRAPTQHLPIGLFGASTGAAAALVAAAQLPKRIAAVVSRGGRPDLARRETLAAVKAPTLIIVGSNDHGVIDLNRNAFADLTCEKNLRSFPTRHTFFLNPVPCKW